MQGPGDEPFFVDAGLELLDEETCRALLASQRVGRVVTTRGDLAVAFPVNYVVVGGDVVFFTGAGTKLTSAVGTRTVTFEVDEIDLERRSGWSVMAFGVASVASETLADRARDLGCWPWAVGPRPHAVRIRPDFLTGRRVVA
jgi:nitroimidazol reductase NimA-like FMN-containing flavoprotein (pyridoxamine 5'-phosphate oxidase superfamily)